MSSAPRAVQCYHCQRNFDVPARAMSISCPWCSKRVTLDDLVVKDTCWTSRVQTCGRLIVHRKGLLVSSSIEARGGMEIHGAVEGKLFSAGPVFIGRFARIKGDLTAPSIDIENGATITGGHFTIATPRRLDGAQSAERRMGTGAAMRPVIKVPGVRGLFKGLRPT